MTEWIDPQTGHVTLFDHRKIDGTVSIGNPSREALLKMFKIAEALRAGLHQAGWGFYVRAFDGLVTRTAAGYNYRGNWASSSGGFSPARTPTSIAAAAYRTGQAELPHPALGKDSRLRKQAYRAARKHLGAVGG